MLAPVTHPIPTLTGRLVRLVPLSVDHVEALVKAASDRTNFGHTNVPHDAVSMHRYVSDLLRDAATGSAIPFVQTDALEHRVVGCTRFMNVVQHPDEAAPSEVEIGGTWLATEAQRTGVNTEAKWLLLRHAFEHWGVARVALCTDARNTRSRVAIERLGATFEGVLRNHRRAHGDLVVAGSPRDSAMYSIVADEWAAVAARLTHALAERH